MLSLSWARRLCFIHAVPETTNRFCWSVSHLLLESSLTSLCCAASYTVHRCFGKTDAVCYNKPCSYGNHKGSVVEDCGLFGPGGTKIDSIPLPRASVCLCQFREWRRDEANANRTRDLCTGVLMTDGWCSLPRLKIGTDALLSRRMAPFDDDILSISLSSWSAWHHRGSHTSQDVMGVVAALLPASLCSLSLWCAPSFK